ncbi:hypothetical protein GCM10011390_01540 [Aureimonas endophytica]|uniref:Diguanylate cyclase (GGDEF)-like protein n=1 Tax=Aureimonas endophytica TaxID=2027858 RepID=A0A917DZ87_9HYPH|nr:bifunctional diguanylate cyclase/phosphodiesterase [Aureimonas endophytica]GGD86623.1 hypothetical protein GCM10011390_01540 [Aureimonas endophytica]
MRRFVERYWATVAGFAVIAAGVVVGTATIGSRTVDDILEMSAVRKAEHFQTLVAGQPRALEALLTGLARDPEEETKLRELATLGGIESFAIFAPDGREAYRTRSDKYEWLLRDRAGGMQSNNRLAASILRMPAPFQLVQDEGPGRISATAPILRDGQLVGYVSLVADVSEDSAGFAGTLAEACLKLAAIFLVAAGVPALVYLKRKHKITEAVARIDFLANHDPITRLLNRRRMQEQVERIISAARVTREEIAYCCIDIDGLGGINHELGQAQGDELLRVVANRLAATIDRGDLLARIAADDFALLHRRAEKVEDMEALAARMRAAVAEPVELKGRLIRPQISIGVARMPRDGKSQNELVKHAQLALARHKVERNGDYAAFEPFMDEETDRRRYVEDLIQRAIDTEGFELAYQPLVGSDGLSLHGFEALLRMRDESGQYVSPAEFVPIAEARGYIKDIGSWVIREATRQAALWPDHIVVSINLSAIQFRDGDLVRIVSDALEAARIEGKRIEVEVVESLILDRTDSVISQLRELKKLGVTIAMDDFGTGYSSLGYLWKFPFDKLKIDRSFMLALEEGQANVKAILGTIVSLAHLMGMTVTTEGVETREQADLLHSLGCDLLQGYLFGKPMPPEVAAAEVLGRFSERMAAQPAARDPALPETSRVSIAV